MEQWDEVLTMDVGAWTAWLASYKARLERFDLHLGALEAERRSGTIYSE
jgi:hypothetical protein